MGEIQKILEQTKFKDRFSFKPQYSITPIDITKYLLNSPRPQIVHFSGHCTNNGELCFQNEHGESHHIQPDALAKLFEQFANDVNCVILNACNTNIPASAIA